MTGFGTMGGNPSGQGGQGQGQSQGEGAATGRMFGSPRDFGFGRAVFGNMPSQQTTPSPPPNPWQAVQDRTQQEQAYTQQFRPGPTGQPYDPNNVPTTGPQGQQLTFKGDQQGYYRPATAAETRQSSQSTQLGWPQNLMGRNQNATPVQGYDAKSRQVFVPYTPSASTQTRQFFQPIYLSRYQNYEAPNFQGPFGGSMDPYGGFNPYGGGFAEGGEVDDSQVYNEGGIAGLLK